MKRKWVIPVALLVVLVASNIWWAYRLLDAGVSCTYLSVSLDDNKAALKQVLALIPYIEKPNITREKIIAVARHADPVKDDLVFQKDGYVWIGSIGLKFNHRGRLIEVRRAWQD